MRRAGAGRGTPTCAAAAEASAPRQRGAGAAREVRHAATTAGGRPCRPVLHEVLQRGRIPGRHVHRDRLRDDDGHAARIRAAAVTSAPSSRPQESAAAARAEPSRRSSPARARPAVRWQSRRASTACCSGPRPGRCAGQAHADPVRLDGGVAQDGCEGMHLQHECRCSCPAVCGRQRTGAAVVHRLHRPAPHHSFGCPQCPQPVSTGCGQRVCHLRCPACTRIGTQPSAGRRCPSSSSAGRLLR